MSRVYNDNAAKRAPAFHGVKPPWKSWRGSIVARRIRFIESQCVIPKGHGAGQLMRLARYQKELIEESRCQQRRDVST